MGRKLRHLRGALGAILAAGVLFGVATLRAADGAGLKPGDPVLARFQLDEDLYYWAARVKEVRGEMVKLDYDDGSTAMRPVAATIPGGFVEGDFVYLKDGTACAVVKDGIEGEVLVRRLEEGATGKPFPAPRGSLRALRRTDSGLGAAQRGRPVAAGNRVLAKWDRKAWYVGTVSAKQGEALLIEYDDGNERWIPADLVVRLSPRPGTPMYGLNARDGQDVPAFLQAIDLKEAKLKFFDGTEESVPHKRVMALVDQPGIDFSDPDARMAKPEKDPRPNMKALRSWLAPTLRYYDESYENEWGTSPAHLEVCFVHYVTKDRKPRPDWKVLTEELAKQVGDFLTRELPGVQVETRAHKEAVVGAETLETYLKTLNDSAMWYVWAPTKAAVEAAFPAGPQKGRHRVVVLLADAPGLAKDDGGYEKGMGFVRIKGEWFGRLSLEGLRAVTEGKVPAGAFSAWREDYIGSTIAHEVLHTIGLPHTDGDPWDIMNLGPWYPITRKEVTLSELHRLVMRSPFPRSLAASQGFAAYLFDPHRAYLRVVAATTWADSSVRLRYAYGAGYFHLAELFAAFGPKGQCRDKSRMFTGERAICRAYLASFFQFLNEVYGTKPLEALRGATDLNAPQLAALAVDKKLPDLEAEWHAWLAKQVEALKAPKATEEPAGAGTGK